MTMTDQQVNERLARFCGWALTTSTFSGFAWVKMTETPDAMFRAMGIRSADPPDYLNDGNAMLELLDALRLDARLWYAFVAALFEQLAGPGRKDGIDLFDSLFGGDEHPPRAVALAAIKVIDNA